MTQTILIPYLNQKPKQQTHDCGTWGPANTFAACVLVQCSPFPCSLHSSPEGLLSLPSPFPGMLSPGPTGALLLALRALPRCCCFLGWGRQHQKLPLETGPSSPPCHNPNSLSWHLPLSAVVSLIICVIVYYLCYPRTSGELRSCFLIFHCVSSA